MAKNTDESKQESLRVSKQQPEEEGGRKARNRVLVSLNDEAVEILERLVKERGLSNNSAAVEFMLVNFGPWVLSADFIAVLADTVRNNRLGGSDGSEV